MGFNSGFKGLSRPTSISHPHAFYGINFASRISRTGFILKILYVYLVSTVRYTPLVANKILNVNRIICLLDYLFTPWSRVFLGKPAGSQIVKKSPHLYVYEWFIVCLCMAPLTEEGARGSAVG